MNQEKQPPAKKAAPAKKAQPRGAQKAQPGQPQKPARKAPARKSPADVPAKKAAPGSAFTPPPAARKATPAKKTTTRAAPPPPAPAKKTAPAAPAPKAAAAPVKKTAPSPAAVASVKSVKPDPAAAAPLDIIAPPGTEASDSPPPPPAPTRPIVTKPAPSAPATGAAASAAAPATGAAPDQEVPVTTETPETTPASAEDVEKAWKDNRLAQVLYHDWEAETYDEKWSISFDDRCITYARDRFSALLGPEILREEEWPYAKALEIGAGTGFFSLNLKQAGVLGEVHVSDVSAGMVENAKQNALKLGFEVQGAVAGAEDLPYEDNTFDVVVGHAVIHHIPDVESAFREMLRVLKPGGRLVIAGEPTRMGDWYARRLGRITWKATTAVTRLKPFRDTWAKSQEELDESSRAAALEAVVDLHTFVPEELRAMAQRAGGADVKIQTEELLAAFLGWPVRTFEAAVNPDALGWGWAMFAYNSWKRLSAVDRVLSRVVPQQAFYNVGVTATKPIR